MSTNPVQALFVDLGGVLLTNAWDEGGRRRAAEIFGLDPEELERRHSLVFETFELGKIGLDDYIRMAVSSEPRGLPPAAFRAFMLAQSKPHPEMLSLVREIKERHRLKVVVVTNEGRELMDHRVRAFDLRGFVDAFVVSCSIHLRKPDADFYRVALDVGQVPAASVVYLDDRALFAEVAAGLGLQAIHHTSYLATRQALAERGLA